MYTIKEASARSGVGIPLLRAWERRYGVVTPARTASGYRLYDEASIERLRAMRQLIADGWSAQQAAQQVRESSLDELAALAHPIIPAAEAARAAAPEGAAVSTDVADALVARLLLAARTLDTAQLEAALDETFGTARFEVAAERVVMPALRAIGDAWERGEVSVAGEHAASHAVLRRLAMAYEAAADGDSSNPVLVGLGPGARHELGALAFAVAARRAGLPVLYLGPDLPANSWTAAAIGRDARAAVVGVPTRKDAHGATQVLTALREAKPVIVLAAGGDQAARVAAAHGALVLPDSLQAAVRELRGQLGMESPAANG
jgi:DNA-binding transcriptional MerR regulator